MTRSRDLLQLVICCLAVVLSCDAQSSQARITVALDGSSDYRSVQAAVTQVTAAGAVIFIKPGTYKEKIAITKDNIWLVGLGKDPKDVVLTFGDSAKNTGSTFKSGTVTVEANGFAAENLTIANTWWDEHSDPADASQAVALQLSSDKAVLDRVRLVSGQDTLFAASRTCRSNTETSPCAASRQYFNDCFVEGNVDYIFGDAKAVFHHCELHSRPHGTIMVTAQSKHFPAEDSGYYFLECRITGANNGNRLVLGRPWREYANVLFYDTDMEQTMAPEGWSEWGDRLKTATYREYKSHGPGVNGGHRAIEYPPLSAEEEKRLTPLQLLNGSDSWNPGDDVDRLRLLVTEGNKSGSPH
jgi:pectinesterase